MKLAKINTSNKISICVPCRDTLHSLFAYNLVQLVQYCNQTNLRVNVLMETGSLISRQRQKLAERAREQGSTHIMWLDSDMMFPTNVIETLLSHDKDLIACNYSTRGTPFKGVAYRTIGDWNSWIGYNITGPRLESVEGVGMGCMLVKTGVMDRMEAPWFEITYSAEYGDHIGEDFYFCLKARELGYDIWVDTALSREIKHLGTTMFDLSRTL